jgi:hypothetical protein
MDLFDVYDQDQSGELDYKEFVGGLYGNTSISKKAAEQEQKKQQANVSDETKSLQSGKSKQAYLNVEG